MAQQRVAIDDTVRCETCGCTRTIIKVTEGKVSPDGVIRDKNKRVWHECSGCGGEA